MARSTCDPNIPAPKGMMKFEVIRSTIRDSLGQYCGPGDMAVLDKKTAKGYLDKNWIKVALPDFDEGDDDEGDTPDENGADEAERTEASSDTRTSPGQRRSRASSNS